MRTTRRFSSLRKWISSAHWTLFWGIDFPPCQTIAQSGMSHSLDLDMKILDQILKIMLIPTISLNSSITVAIVITSRQRLTHTSCSIWPFFFGTCSGEFKVCQVTFPAINALNLTIDWYLNKNDEIIIITGLIIIKLVGNKMSKQYGMLAFKVNSG